MTNEELVRLFALIEAKVAVEDWRIDGLRIWPLVRAQTMFDNFFMYRRKDETAAAKGRLARLGPLETIAKNGAGYVRALLRDKRANDRLRSVDAMLYSDGVSFLRLDGQYYERFCDPLRERLSARGKDSLLVTPLGRFHTPRHSPSVFVQPRVDLAHLRGMIGSRLRKNHERELTGWDDALALGRSAFPDIRLKSPAHYERATDYVHSFEGMYRRLLERTRPNVVFIVSYYGAEAMALIRACRGLGIATVDLQHGCINDAHWAYARWSRLPTGGFDLLPRWFWVWSETEAQTIRSWSDRSHEAHAPLVGGNLFLHAWREGTSDVVKASDARVLAIQDKTPTLRTVLYTTNGFETELELARLRDAIDRSKDDLFWWVRLHPAAPGSRALVERELGRAAAASYLVDPGDEIPLYGVLRHADGHVTEASSTVIEAAELGVPTVLLSRRESVMYTDLIERRWALVIDPEDDLASAVRSRIGHAGDPAANGASADPLDVLFPQL